MPARRMATPRPMAPWNGSGATYGSGSAKASIVSGTWTLTAMLVRSAEPALMRASAERLRPMLQQMYAAGSHGAVRSPPGRGPPENSRSSPSPAYPTKSPPLLTHAVASKYGTVNMHWNRDPNELTTHIEIPPGIASLDSANTFSLRTTARALKTYDEAYVAIASLSMWPAPPPPATSVGTTVKTTPRTTRTAPESWRAWNRFPSRTCDKAIVIGIITCEMTGRSAPATFRAAGNEMKRFAASQNPMRASFCFGHASICGVTTPSRARSARHVK
mmetsp:Transcript_21013/g.67992  ORF Transcript_21013/g.67992 Transcript_21013/m.67992 type:complete len:274 (+) Transcript_21013:293-1114(+)